MDAFDGELISSGAYKGMIYSFAGYTKPALEKARKLGICCCKLYLNDKPDLPENLNFKSYCCTSRIKVTLKNPPVPYWNIVNYNDLFNIIYKSDGSESRVIDLIHSGFIKMEKTAVEQVKEGKFPLAWVNEITLNETDEVNGLTPKPLCIVVEGSWKVYEGKLEAHLLEGSYSFSSGEFHGSQTGPAIDMQGPHPGPGWKLIMEPPSLIGAQCVAAILYGGNVRDVLLEKLGQRPIIVST
jgi:hypothetical protein